jgi:hypothetical protein
VKGLDILQHCGMQENVTNKVLHIGEDLLRWVYVHCVSATLSLSLRSCYFEFKFDYADTCRSTM